MSLNNHFKLCFAAAALPLQNDQLADIQESMVLCLSYVTFSSYCEPHDWGNMSLCDCYACIALHACSQDILMSKFVKQTF